MELFNLKSENEKPDTCVTNSGGKVTDGHTDHPNMVGQRSLTENT